MIRVSFPPYEGQPLKQETLHFVDTGILRTGGRGEPPRRWEVLHPGRGLAITWDELIHKPLVQGLHIYRFISYAVTNVERV